jgi:hypothetical protein
LRLDLLDLEVEIFEALVKLRQYFEILFAETTLELPRSGAGYSSSLEEEKVRGSLDPFRVVGLFLFYFARDATTSCVIVIG